MCTQLSLSEIPRTARFISFFHKVATKEGPNRPPKHSWVRAGELSRAPITSMEGVVKGTGIDEEVAIKAAAAAKEYASTAAIASKEAFLKLEQEGFLQHFKVSHRARSELASCDPFTL